jgi:hypothetical protein
MSKPTGFKLIHIDDIIRRIRAHIAIARAAGDEAGAKRLEFLLMEFEG